MKWKKGDERRGGEKMVASRRKNTDPLFTEGVSQCVKMKDFVG